MTKLRGYKCNTRVYTGASWHKRGIRRLFVHNLNSAQIHHTLLLWLACTFCSSLFSNGYLRNNGITTLSFCLNCQRSIIDLAMHCALGRLCVFQIKTLIMSHCLFKPLPLTRLPCSSRCTIPIVMALVQVFSVIGPPAGITCLTTWEIFGLHH